ncbi:MAG: flagellin N-terminal helical domain-containing protein [Phycisphaerales bacterium]
MTRINTNVPSMIAQRVLGQNSMDLNTALNRLSTGLRINRGKDDPAGLIASENLRAEISGLGQAIKNAERADQVVNIAEGGLNEVSSLLTELQSLVTQTANSAGLSDEERVANQLQVDSILQTIDRIANSTSFQGKRLLNGSLDYIASGVNTQIENFRVNGAKLTYNGTLDVDVLVTQSAQLGGFVMSFGGANLDLTNADSQFVFEVTGTKGSREFSFASGTALTEVVDAINTFADVTGVSAVTYGAGGIRLLTTDYGGSEFVSLRVVDDGGSAGNGVYNVSATNSTVYGAGAPTAFTAITNRITDFGRDVSATVNGIVATTSGREIRINTDFLDVELQLAVDAGNPSAITVGAIDAFTVSGGGADFQLASRVDISGKVSLGIGNVSTRTLGRDRFDYTDSTGTTTERSFLLSDLAGGQDLNLVDGDLTGAQRVLESAIKEVSKLRGRLGAFQANTVGATIRSLGITLENTSAAESMIRDADFASETAELTRAQILSQSALTTLGQANTQPQQALQLLG